MNKETTSSKSDLLDKLSIDFEIDYPTIIIVNNGEMYANIVNVEDTETVKTFINKNKVRKNGTVKE